LGVDINDKLQGLSFDDQFSKAFKYWMTHDKQINTYRICSFSEDPFSMLMWSYYGAGHSGLCLELDVSEYEKDIHQVNYVSEILKSNDQSILYLLTHKLDAWAHEKEYRWISNENTRYKYLKANIRAVLLGTSIDLKYFRPIFEMCARMNIQIDIASFNTSGELLRFPLKKGIRWDELG